MKQNNTSKQSTYFGFRSVMKEEKTHLVTNVFHSVASKYDFMNDLMSLGIHRIWKRLAIKYSNVQPGQRVLDLAGGTGDLTEQFYYLVGKTGLVVLADLNSSMLKIGRDKLRNKGLISKIYYVQTNAEALPFPDNFFDCIAIAFGLRNITEIDTALRSMLRTLKKGGRLLVLEFSHPKCTKLHRLYNLYNLHILPCIGKIVAQDYHSYRYLAESIQMHPNQETLKQMMIDIGFQDTTYKNLTGGIVALHCGFKF
ncbi:bifunctional demethylmenaquinone methyltransferase/2-methoxy-6-polyprenyl-1,4-benzoquinol methylase UbiE [Candidatus Erwinia haradaeae]|uniref:Ubiquinone/menaquinone biosynthesis C-methyltransferase UbiE n=1 Tax=Candidatus Erwinia haradaeae TaxID=1922217 RepID=A0A451D8X3_9GAMM|nr:bifunctional demethylmenaquinone methyltransferase/2-methoxy-6-polyprenyl-1,4-benzoquinol methylase UbiE [Candidatus Erwinia haradaeae]VFP82223.1 Ubiquinone/menaquinone biosynthesis C-methyltransferase UbiE [Candidatus Erwinia haradaeae]